MISKLANSVLIQIPPKHIHGNDRIFKTEFPNESSQSMNYEYDKPNTNDITSINKRKRNSISGKNYKYIVVFDYKKYKISRIIILNNQ